MKNRELARIFSHIADLLEIDGESRFRVLAYRRAAQALLELGRDVEAVWKEGRLESIPGIGTAIAKKIDELLRTGELTYLKKLEEEVPPSLAEMLAISDLGPKKVARFWRELGITTIDELEAAAREGRLQSLSGVGSKSEARLLANIEAYRKRASGRVLVDVACNAAAELLGALRATPHVLRAEAAGSLRRSRETIGDLDLVVASQSPPEVLSAFTALPKVAEIKALGETKASVVLREGLRAQLWVHPPERFGSAWQYATGSQAHNVRLREYALKKGLSLSEHGFKRADGGEILCGEEERVYKTLDLPWIAPELREDRGEIEAAAQGDLPDLIDEGDLKGELHTHTTWSDGSERILDLAKGALMLGCQYLAITDHSRSLGVANGLSVERLKEQRAEIERAQQALGDEILLLQGAEVEILASGELDYPQEILAGLDIVIASLHTSLRQPRKQVMERMLGAIRNPHVDMIAHPTGRLIGKRDPADLDMAEIIAAAAAHGVALGINANPERLDLKDVHARMAVEAGCLLAINSDAHHADQLAYRRYGIGIARRGWVTPELVVNAWPTDRLLAWLRSRGG